MTAEQIRRRQRRRVDDSFQGPDRSTHTSQFGSTASERSGAGVAVEPL